jgi:hypothetical protein
VTDVRLHRLLADDQARGDLRIRQALGDEPQHLGLAERQRRQGRRRRSRPLLAFAVATIVRDTAGAITTTLMLLFATPMLRMLVTDPVWRGGWSGTRR